MGWSICSGGRVEAVAAGSDCWGLYGCWAGCGDSYELVCRGSLALVNEEGEASGACADGACADGACIVAGVGRLGRGSSFEACGLIAFS